MQSAVDKLVGDVGAALAPIAPVRVAWVFGSRVRGTSRPDSDLDVGVVFARGLDDQQRFDARLEVIAALTDALGGLGERADVVDLMDCDSAVAFAAVCEGRRCLERARDERVEAAVRIGRRYDDDAPWRALQREALRRLARGAA